MPRKDLTYVKVEKKKKTYSKNCWAKKIQDVQRELRALKKKYKQAGEGERQPLTEVFERKSEKENIVPCRSHQLRLKTTRR